jgi:transposase InsO family protein
MNKREYSRDFKLMGVRQVETGGKRPVQACREDGLANSGLDRWRNEYRARGEEAFTLKNASSQVTKDSRRQIQPGLIHHSDRGVHYGSTPYVERLHSVQAAISLSATGNGYENAKAESFFKTLKYEEVYLKQYRTFEEAEHNLRQFIEDVYTTKLLHSSLDYLPPSEFEAVHRGALATS